MKTYEQIFKADDKTVHDYVKLSLLRFLISKENLKNIEHVIKLITEIYMTRKNYNSAYV